MTLLRTKIWRLGRNGQEGKSKMKTLRGNMIHLDPPPRSRHLARRPRSQLSNYLIAGTKRQPSHAECRVGPERGRNALKVRSNKQILFAHCLSTCERAAEPPRTYRAPDRRRWPRTQRGSARRGWSRAGTSRAAAAAPRLGRTRLQGQGGDNTAGTASAEGSEKPHLSRCSPRDSQWFGWRLHQQKRIFHWAAILF